MQDGVLMSEEPEGEREAQLVYYFEWTNLIEIGGYVTISECLSLFVTLSLEYYLYQ